MNIGMVDTFSFKRLFHLIANDLRVNAKIISIVAVTLILFFALLPYHDSTSPSTYFDILYVGGFIITSFAFSDLHDRNRSHIFLMLPSSNVEKLLNRWFLTSVGYAVAVLAGYYIFSQVSAFIYYVLFGIHSICLSLQQPELWYGIGQYLVMQSVVLLGAIVFRKYVLVKTALALGCLFLLLSAFSLLVTSILFVPGYFSNGVIMEMLLKGVHIMVWFLLAPFCLYMTYLRLTEYELI